MISTEERASVTEDPLAYLPNKRVIEYRRNEIIYDEDHPSGGISLIVDGRVKVATMEAGSEVVIGILGPNNFFGECGVLGTHVDSRQTATALENTALMAWTTAEIEAQIERNAKLGLALIQAMVARCVEFEERLESLALNPMAARLAVGLLHLAKGGTPEADGAVRIPAVTHQIVAGYIGASREMVTGVLNQWRHRGLAGCGKTPKTSYLENVWSILYSCEAQTNNRRTCSAIYRRNPA